MWHLGGLKSWMYCVTLEAASESIKSQFVNPIKKGGLKPPFRSNCVEFTLLSVNPYVW